LNSALKVLIVGYGKRAQSVWLPILIEYLKVDKLTVLDQTFDGKKLKKNTKIIYETSNSILKKNKYDLTIICVPPNSHLKVLNSVIDVSSKIILETPFGKTSKQKKLIKSLSEKWYGKIYLFDNFLYNPTHLYIKYLSSFYGRCMFHGKVNDFMGSHSTNQFNDIFKNGTVQNYMNKDANGIEIIKSCTYHDILTKSFVGFELAGDFSTNINRPSRPGLQFSYFERATLTTNPFGNISLIQKIRRKLGLKHKYHIGYLYVGKSTENIYLYVDVDWVKIGGKNIMYENPFAKKIKIRSKWPSKSKRWIYSSILIGLREIVSEENFKV